MARNYTSPLTTILLLSVGYIINNAILTRNFTTSYVYNILRYDCILYVVRVSGKFFVDDSVQPSQLSYNSQT